MRWTNLVGKAVSALRSATALHIVVFTVSCLGCSFGETPENVFSRKAGLERKLNTQIPLGLTFRDETGRLIALKSYFGSKPVILVLAYYECPNLCTLVLNALLNSVQDLKADVGKDFEIVVVSFDDRETAALASAKKRTYATRYGRPGTERGWHFLTGDAPVIGQLASSIGFSFVFDPATRQFAHPSAITVLTPEGKISRYFAGIEYPPKELRVALIDASNHLSGSLTDELFLLCYHYNPLTGKYGLVVMQVVRVAGFATVGALACFMTVMLRRERKKELGGSP
ncbi:MAG: uncharacterized protein JWM99_4181 [Verrucomicrobiales bacterium]|nr:uncharacterized protein [Verrucomicrobiales bacterium]